MLSKIGDFGLKHLTVGNPGSQNLSNTTQQVTAPIPTAQTIDLTASQLADSIGVMVHAGYDDTVYKNTDLITSKLLKLGITRIRDGVGVFSTSTKAYMRPFYVNLINNGIKINFIAGAPSGIYGQYGTGSSASFVAALKDPAQLAGLVDSLEGPNEWDINGGSNWIADLRAWCNEYYGALNADPALTSIPFYGPAMAFSSGFSNYGTDTSSWDAATLHPYAGGQMPENNGFPNSSSSDWVGRARATAGSSIRLVATEIGYNNAVNNTVSGNLGVPEDVASHYLLRTLVWNLSLGIKLNYIYQLSDQKPDDPGRTDIESWFGLLAVEGDKNANLMTWTLREKPAFTAVKNFISCIKDAGQGVAVSTFPYTIVGADTDVSVIPFARKDGSIDFIAWRRQSLYNQSSKATVSVSATKFGIRFARPVSIQLFRPSVDNSSTVISSSTSEIALSIDGYISIYRCLSA